MKTITFNQIKTSSIALEMDEVIPDEIYSWTKEDFAKYVEVIFVYLQEKLS